MAQSILIVDDDADTRSLVGASLTEQGFIVYAARDGRHALQILERSSPPALILLDYNMPVMNGKEFLAVKRSDPRWQAIPSSFCPPGLANGLLPGWTLSKCFPSPWISRGSLPS